MTIKYKMSLLLVASFNVSSLLKLESVVNVYLKHLRITLLQNIELEETRKEILKTV